MIEEIAQRNLANRCNITERTIKIREFKQKKMQWEVNFDNIQHMVEKINK